MKTIKITQSQLRNTISESVKKVLSEISWGTAADAVDKSDNRVDMLDGAMYDFEEACNKMQQALKGEAYEHWYGDDEQPENTQGPILAQKIENLFSEVQTYVQRKKKQLVSLKGHEKDKFNQAFGGRTADQVANDIGDTWDKHFDDENYVPWEKYRQTALTKDEQDFNDRNP